MESSVDKLPRPPPAEESGSEALPAAHGVRADGESPEGDRTRDKVGEGTKESSASIKKPMEERSEEQKKDFVLPVEKPDTKGRTHVGQFHCLRSMMSQ